MDAKFVVVWIRNSIGERGVWNCSSQDQNNLINLIKPISPSLDRMASMQMQPQCCNNHNNKGTLSLSSTILPELLLCSTLCVLAAALRAPCQHDNTVLVYHSCTGHHTVFLHPFYNRQGHRMLCTLDVGCVRGNHNTAACYMKVLQQCNLHEVD